MRRTTPAGRRNPRQKSATEGALDLLKQKMVAAMQTSLEAGEDAAVNAKAKVQPGLDVKVGVTEEKMGTDPISPKFRVELRCAQR